MMNKNRATYARRSAKIILRCSLVLICLMLVLGTQPAGLVQAQSTITFTGAELLGRPTNNSITVKIIPASTIDYYYEYGTSSGSYPNKTATVTANGGQPSSITITGLSPNTQYYYRMQYNSGGSGWVARTAHSFWTQRAPGTSFTFDITSDSHVNIMLGSASTWTNTMNNVVADHPDFLVDLGDTFAMDDVSNQAGADSAYTYQRQFFDKVGNSASIFLAPGNHEEQEGWHLDDTGNPLTSKPVTGTNAQKKYYLNPIPDSFYSGNSDPYASLDGDHLREDYYAWRWGDALFVVIDPFWYTMSKPFTGNTGGGESSDTGTGNRWDWTLGLTQFNWLKSTLENSDAPYKFVLTHQMAGGGEDYGHGGANSANLVEWGGYNESGSAYEWEAKRPGWGSDPIHALFVANQVSAFIHGHDHQYGYEKRDGVVYLSMPSAGFSGNGFNYYTTGNGYTIQGMASPGHVRVSVTPNQASFDYIATSSGQSSYTFTIKPSEAPEGILGDVDNNGKADSTDALIVLSGDAGLNVASHCPMNCGDVNADGKINSTDALILLTYNVGLSVSYNVGQPGCPASVTQPKGCTP